jgi:hypothetical protein
MLIKELVPYRFEVVHPVQAAAFAVLAFSHTAAPEHKLGPAGERASASEVQSATTTTEITSENIKLLEISDMPSTRNQSTAREGPMSTEDSRTYPTLHMRFNPEKIIEK